MASSLPTSSPAPPATATATATPTPSPTATPTTTQAGTQTATSAPTQPQPVSFDSDLEMTIKKEHRENVLMTVYVLAVLVAVEFGLPAPKDDAEKEKQKSEQYSWGACVGISTACFGLLLLAALLTWFSRCIPTHVFPCPRCLRLLCCWSPPRREIRPIHVRYILRVIITLAIVNVVVRSVLTHLGGVAMWVAAGIFSGIVILYYATLVVSTGNLPCTRCLFQDGEMPRHHLTNTAESNGGTAGSNDSQPAGDSNESQPAGDSNDSQPAGDSNDSQPAGEVGHGGTAGSHVVEIHDTDDTLAGSTQSHEVSPSPDLGDSHVVEIHDTDDTLAGSTQSLEDEVSPSVEVRASTTMLPPLPSVLKSSFTYAYARPDCAAGQPGE